MSTPPEIVDAGSDDFDREALGRSYELPVLVDFWADWCEPCKALAPILESLAIAYAGRMRLVKVDADAHPELAGRFGVRGLPTLKLFHRGEPVGELVGLQPESVIRALVDPFTPRPTDADVARARSLLDEGETARARHVLRAALDADPDNPRIAPELASALLASSDGDALDALDALLASIPATSRLDDEWRAIGARAAFAREAASAPDEATLAAHVGDDPGDCASRFTLGGVLAARGDFEGAVEQLIEILRRQRGFRDGAARDALVGIFTILGDQDPRVRDYRSRMASALY